MCLGFKESVFGVNGLGFKGFALGCPGPRRVDPLQRFGVSCLRVGFLGLALAAYALLAGLGAVQRSLQNS